MPPAFTYHGSIHRPILRILKYFDIGGVMRKCVSLVHSNGQTGAPDGSPYRTGSGLVLLPRALRWANGLILDGWSTSTPPPPNWCSQLLEIS